MSETAADFWTDADIISAYTREDALADGVLVDVSEWASHDKGFHGGFRVPVVMTRALFDVVDCESWPEDRRPRMQDTRGRAHDVLWMASLALRGALARDPQQTHAAFDVLLTHGRSKKARLWAVIDGDGVTIGYPEDF